MAARDHLNGEQLRMFIPARELAQHTSADAVFEHDYANDSYFDQGSESEKVAYGPFNKTSMYKEKQKDLHSPTYRWDDYDQTHRTLSESLDKKGIHTPVELQFNSDFDTKGHGQPAAVIVNGHHRVVYANEKNPNMEVPVVYEDMN
jgi:hypothetical protein